MRFYIYATHSDGYFEDLLDSLRLFNADYTIDGMGEPWIGYKQKLQGILQFAKQQPPNEVISVLDAFDSLLIRDPFSMEENFRISGQDLIYAHDHYFLYSNYFGRKYREKKWGCSRPLLNAGASIGFAKTYAKVVSMILDRLDRDQVKVENVDDQKELCLYYRHHATVMNMGIDERSEFFYLTMGLKRFLPKDQSPWIISGPGKQSLRLYVYWMRKKFVDFYQRIPFRHVLSRKDKVLIKWKRW